MPFFEWGAIGSVFDTSDPRIIRTERTFREKVYFDRGFVTQGDIAVTGDGTITGDVEVDGLTADNLILNAQSSLAATIAPTAYPLGSSFMSVSSDSSWPIATGFVRTFVYAPSTAGWRIHQVIYGKSAEPSYERFSDDGTTWDNWRLTAPIKRLGATSSSYTTTATGAWQTAHTFTISGLPTTRFEATVDVVAGCYAGNPGTPKYMRALISLDGGTTWFTTKQSVGDAGWHVFSIASMTSGAITGTIQLQIQVKSDGSNSTFREFTNVVTIGNNY